MIRAIIKLLNKVSATQIIPAHSTREVPAKPYATYFVITKQTKDFHGASEKKYDQNNNEFIEKRKYRTVATLQFDVYEDSLSGEFEKAQRLYETIIFNLRKKWGQIEVGIVEFSEVRFLREEIQNEYERRASFDVTFEYMSSTEERRVEIAEVIELIANDEINKIKEE